MNMHQRAPGLRRRNDVCEQSREILYAIFLPLADNDGNPFSQELLDEITQEITGFGDGSPALPEGEGMWINNGRLGPAEPIYVILASVPDTAASACLFVNLTEEFRCKLRQTMIYVIRLPVEVMRTLAAPTVSNPKDGSSRGAK